MLCVSNYFDATVLLAVVAQLHTWMNQNLPRLVACFQEARDLPTDIYTCNNAIECSHQIIVSVEVVYLSFSRQNIVCMVDVHGFKYLYKILVSV